ncbi:hypothetical protein [Nocardia higoensis]|uniref:hypothetical protein n=1 Tax=Nocardia higoensis TaxID=228599 RepID=UPI0012F684E4|nr:hypothetical protein [Nocardia higoensis]
MATFVVKIQGLMDTTVEADQFKEVGELVIFFDAENSGGNNRVFAVPTEKLASIHRVSAA